MKVLSIIIPAYNVEKYLEEAMAPYLRMKNHDCLEVIIVNDGSTDGTLQLARKYEKEYPLLVRVVDKENGGHGSAINSGVREASGKYFKVVDGDDWVDRNSLENIVQILSGIDVDMIATGFTIVCEETDEKENIHIGNVEFEKEYLFSDVCDNIDYIRMHSTIFRTELWKAHHIMLDEHCFYVDVEHDLLPLEWVKTIRFYDELLYQYRIGRPGQSVNIESMIRNRENHERVIKRIMNYSKSANISDSIKMYIQRKLENMIGFHYSILFAVPLSETARDELVKFDRWLKENHSEIYNSVKQKKIVLMRKMNFRNYYFVKRLYKILGKKEEEYIK